MVLIFEKKSHTAYYVFQIGNYLASKQSFGSFLSKKLGSVNFCYKFLKSSKNFGPYFLKVQYQWSLISQISSTGPYMGGPYITILRLLNKMKGTYMNNKNKEICKEKFELMYVQVKDVSKVSKLEKKFSRSLSPEISMLRRSLKVNLFFKSRILRAGSLFFSKSECWFSIRPFFIGPYCVYVHFFVRIYSLTIYFRN